MPVEKTVVILPTYNEKENLEVLAEQILASPLVPHLVIVDDASPDGTGLVAEALAQRNGRVHPLHRPAKLGLGTAYLAGFQRALVLGATQIITMDADFSHHPRYLPFLAANSGEAGLIVGSRYIDGGGVRNW
ncbi:MAG: glycosyltransferase, partial [Chloroflexi bacterium]|nr:glycosyltransferase [Chloroflexota bacterium]